MKKEDRSKYFFLALLGIVAAISLVVIFPFLLSIIGGALLAYIFYPVHKRLKKRTYTGVSAFLVTILILLIITIPSILIMNHLTQETHYIYLRAKQQLKSGELIEDRCYDNSFICRTVKDANNLLRDENVKTYISNLLNDTLSFLTKRFSEIIFSLPTLILNLVVTLFTAFYLLKDGKKLIDRVARFLPLKALHHEQIIKQFGDVTHAIIYGSFIVALVQGTLGAFGLWFFGIKSFIWWALIMTFFALIPFIGTWIVWMPASAILMLSGYLQGETTLIWNGVGLFLYGLLIVSTIDNILKPFIVAGRARVHPLLVFVGILGGIFVFGILGLLIGPLILALLQTLFEIYEQDHGKPKKK